VGTSLTKTVSFIKVSIMLTKKVDLTYFLLDLELFPFFCLFSPSSDDPEPDDELPL
jgi:hypothetical protein